MEIASIVSTWPAFTTEPGSEDCQAKPSTALDLLASIATSDVRIYNSPAALGITKLDNSTVGRGGASLVDRGLTDDGKLVAAKQALLWPGKLLMKDHNNFEKYLRQICLELRILTHDRIKAHKNIVDIIGCCWDEPSGRPYLALVLEYSSHGTLKTFLQSHTDLLDSDLVSFAAQVAAGLEVLHEHKICHGDVKTQNALVFSDGDSIIVKLSDFSEALIGAINDSTGHVAVRWGTRLLNAPEIRTGTAMSDESYNIDFAILTDVYSFGLLLWETMKHGQSYFDKHWYSSDWQAVDVESMEAYLCDLPCNGLLDKAIEFTRERMGEQKLAEHVLKAFEGSIQDNAHRRFSMTKIRRILEVCDHAAEPHTDDTIQVSEMSSLRAWDTDSTILDLFETGAMNGVLLDTVPYQIQSRIVAELELLATSPSVVPISRSLQHCVSPNVTTLVLAFNTTR